MIQTPQTTGHLVAHFFYSHSNKSRLKAAHLFTSYIKQILGYLDMNGKQVPPRIISYVKRFYGPKTHHPKFEEIIGEIFVPLSELLSSVTYVVDGLDECEPEEVRKVLKIFQKTMSQPGTKVFISGREALDVINAIPGSIAVVISDENNREDICRFIEWRIEEKMRERQLTEKKSLLQDVKRKLNEKADRMSV
jgi:KAP family P-loop domain